MKPAFRVLAVAFMILCGGGCANHDQDQNPNASTIPWNKPQGWESGGMMGNMMPGSEEGSTGSPGHY